MRLQKPFGSDEEFMRYIEEHSKISRTLFYTYEINHLYVLAGKRPPYECLLPIPLFALQHDKPATRQLLDKAIENVAKKAELARLIEKASKESGVCEIFILNDYR